MDVITTIKNELELEAKAIQIVAAKIDKTVEEAVNILFNCTGKVVVTGMGKTGIIARKIAATLASTGTTSIFLHSAEGIHGDIGILGKKDVVIAVSYSGNTDELISIIPYIKFLKIPLIAICGNTNSRLSKNSDVVINVNIPKEFEPFGLVPTSSTTVSLAIGDALAVALLKKRNFKESDFAQVHPGGTIGKKLLIKVQDLMHTNEKNPVISYEKGLDLALLEITSKNLGCTSVVDESGKLIGIITDGDLRRMLSKGIKFLQTPIKEIMTKSPLFLKPETLAVKALSIMEDHEITMLPVVNEKNEPIGMLHMHDLINSGVVG
ncbi:MAG: KpsF/GutQ family sugar-phosphate isomerase [Candidatus Cloacimonetes bacterium]|nr:KpsF/GutQ family sugar-phosphate isomerase [Candidatus Cloacimonadota bacterium]